AARVSSTLTSQIFYCEKARAMHAGLGAPGEQQPDAVERVELPLVDAAKSLSVVGDRASELIQACIDPAARQPVEHHPGIDPRSRAGASHLLTDTRVWIGHLVGEVVEVECVVAQAAVLCLATASHQ